ncbi:MAG: hypothetical protein ACKOA4_02060 [Haliscomenobacter sp.]
MSNTRNARGKSRPRLFSDVRSEGFTGGTGKWGQQSAGVEARRVQV